MCVSCSGTVALKRVYRFGCDIFYLKAIVMETVLSYNLQEPVQGFDDHALIYIVNKMFSIKLLKRLICSQRNVLQ